MSLQLYIVRHGNHAAHVWAANPTAAIQAHAATNGINANNCTATPAPPR
jgi:hypothetical protein